MSTASPARIVLVGGGVRSGKSNFAQKLAESFSGRRIFVATGQALDGEMRDRIVRHQAERADRFETVASPVHLPETLRRIGPCEVVLVDCLTLWLSNLLCRPDAPVGSAALAMLEGEIASLQEALQSMTATVVLVTNEVGMGVVPPSALGRVFRDGAGRLHQSLAERADEVYFAAMGLVMRIKPNPVLSFSPANPTRPLVAQVAECSKRSS